MGAINVGRTLEAEEKIMCPASTETGELNSDDGTEVVLGSSRENKTHVE